MPGTLPKSSEHSCTSSTGSLISLDSCLSKNSGHSSKSNLSVGFSKKVKAKKIPRAIDYSEDERNATWYDDAELEEIKFENKITLQTSKASAYDIPLAPPSGGVKPTTNNKAINDSDDEYIYDNIANEERYCLRGLEKQTTKYQETTKPFLQKSRAWVLEEQEKQRAQGINDPSRLAKISQQATKSEIRLAYIRASVDKQIAEELAKADQEIGSTVSSENRAMALKAKRKQKIMASRQSKIMASRHSGSDLIDLERQERKKKVDRSLAAASGLSIPNSGGSKSTKSSKPVKRSTSGPNLRTLKVQ